jgi:hypothetical protein
MSKLSLASSDLFSIRAFTTRSRIRQIVKSLSGKLYEMLSFPSGISLQSYKYFYTICRKFWNIVQIVPFLYDGPNQNNPRRTKILRRPSTLLYVIFQKYSASCHQQQNSYSPTSQLCTFDTDSSQIDQQYQSLDHDITFQFLIRKQL